MKKINDTIISVKKHNSNLFNINDENYESLSHIEKLELLLTIKNWVKDQFDKIANT